MSGKYQERLSQLEGVLKEDLIDLQQLRASSSSGIPESLRPLSWRLLLEYLPPKRAEWTEFLQKQRQNYGELVLDMIVRPGDSNSEQADHPLNPNPDSAWSNYFKDNEVLLQIDKDVRRLCPEMSFFQQPTPFPNRPASRLNLSKRINSCNLHAEVFETSRSGATNFVASSRKKAVEQYKSLDEGDEAHWQVVERILFIYSKLNPGVKYVQGMNEVLGPLYYVFAQDTNDSWAEHAEADTYYCFQNLMSEIKDNFIKTLDQSNCGIEWTMTRFYERFKDCDPDLYEYLVTEQGLLPQYYAFRWLSLLLSQEFLLPDVITIWDALFADDKRFEFLQYVCLAMLYNARDRLLQGDFSANMRLLQNYPEVDVGQLVVIAHDLKEGNLSVISKSDSSNSMDRAKKPTTISSVLSSTLRSFTGKS
uniref:TBC1 domain family member 13 n=1 Tax=Plectus sambesii TaxID=2011161 RepID=A0A914WIC4_9BILA